MRILGIDTSGYVNAIGLVDGDRVMRDFAFEAEADSLEKLVVDIDSTLRSAMLSLQDVEGFGVSLGPGSWTGLKVGVTVAKILAYAMGKPISGVPTLEVLACEARTSSDLICPIISAPKDAVYAGFYRARGTAVTRLGEYYVGDILTFLRMITEPAVFIGSGAQLHGELIDEVLGSQGIRVEVAQDSRRGSAVALLAAARLEQRNVDDVLSLGPLYLKEPTARAFLSRYLTHTQPRGQAK